MKKIGITTMYTDSVNYGGLLQSYALCRILYKLGYEAEQIRFPIESKDQKISMLNQIKNLNLIQTAWFLRWKIRTDVDRALKQFGKTLIKTQLKKRNDAFKEFRDSIPHSKEVFSIETLPKAAFKYNAFIAGSDQIWNPGSYHPAFYLEFCGDKPKIAYAASMAVSSLSEDQKKIYKKRLSKFEAISVREAEAVDVLRDISPVPVEHVLDPTLLLDRTAWDEVCDDSLGEKEYIFCYFLGDDRHMRRITKTFAKEKGLKIITIPNMLGSFRWCDLSFGNEKRYDVTPSQFISLIKNATYVFTDSFHATVFSVIYDKPFFVFERAEYKNMNSRINSLLSLVKADNRFCSNGETKNLNYIKTLDEKTLVLDKTELNEYRSRSFKFMEDALVYV